jgi:putative restriction endonuclease
LTVSPVADRPSLLMMGIKPDAKVNVGEFSEWQRVFLEYHRENVLRMSRRR